MKKLSIYSLGIFLLSLVANFIGPDGHTPYFYNESLVWPILHLLIAGASFVVFFVSIFLYKLFPNKKYKNISLKPILLSSILMELTSITINTLDLSPPTNNPTLWVNLSDMFFYQAINLLIIWLVTLCVKYLFKKYSGIHKLIFWLLLPITPLIMGYYAYTTIIQNSYITDYPTPYSMHVCKLCKYGKGDIVSFLHYYEYGNYAPYIGEIIAVEGDKVTTRDGVISVNDIDSSFSLLSWVNLEFNTTTTLQSGEYYILIGDIPRDLSSDDFARGKTTSEYIVGKVTNYIEPTVLDVETPEGLESYYSTYDDPHSIYLREALNLYLEGDTSSFSKEVLDKHFDELYIYGLRSFSNEYYQSKFAIHSIEDSPIGGKVIQIIFVDKPDKFFYSWVYQLADETYELRGFFIENSYDEVSMQKYLRYYSPLINNPNHAL